MYVYIYIYTYIFEYMLEYILIITRFTEHNHILITKHTHFTRFTKL